MKHLKHTDNYNLIVSCCSSLCMSLQASLFFPIIFYLFLCFVSIYSYHFLFISLYFFIFYLFLYRHRHQQDHACEKLAPRSLETVTPQEKVESIIGRNLWQFQINVFLVASV